MESVNQFAQIGKLRSESAVIKKLSIITDCIVLSNVVTPTRKSLEFKHASQ